MSRRKCCVIGVRDLVSGEQKFVNPDAMHWLFVVLSGVAAHQEPSCGNADERGNVILFLRAAIGRAVLQPLHGSGRPQCADDVFDSILLKQADGGNAGRSGFQARGWRSRS